MFRSAYDSKRVRSASSNVDDDGNFLPSRVQQSQTANCDINNIIKRHDHTGLLDHVNKAVAQYGDYTTVNEYQVALNTVLQAQESFNSLPASVRSRFNNNPGSFFEYATNPANLAGMIEMGLAEAPPLPLPSPAPAAVAPVPAAPAAPKV